MPDPVTGLYDAVPYVSRPLPQTHPDRLAAMATLFGMEPAAASRCRVLELGCGDAGNLLPMALTLPGGEFVGVDTSPGALARGQERAGELGLANVTLRQADFRDLPAELGRFDYVIANGLYSWVPADVRDALLAVCRDRLNPNGVAFVSYNAYPGCRQREMVREMLRYRVRQVGDPRARMTQAREFARFLAENQPPTDSANSSLARELREVLQHEDFLFFHDDLADVNVPVYFHEFVEHAGRFGLQFLAEAEFHEMQEHALPPRAVETVRRLAGDDVIAKEQYLDFLKCRRYRQTLLCHAGVPLQRPPRPAAVQRFRVASPTRPAREPARVDAGVEEPFQGPRGATMSTAYPPVKAILLVLKDVWPRSLPFAELAERTRSLLRQANAPQAAGPESEPAFLAEVVLRLYSAALVEFLLEEPPFTLELGERPVASPLARLQARDREPVLTNLRHAGIIPRDALVRQLVYLLDGRRDRAALLSELAAFAAAEGAPLPPTGQSAADPQAARAALAGRLDADLAGIARLALLWRTG